MIIDVLDGLDETAPKTLLVLQRLGHDPIVLRLACPREDRIKGPAMNAVRFMVDAVACRARRPRAISLLRIYGHGNAGVQRIFGGRDHIAHYPYGLSTIDFDSLDRQAPTLSRLRPYFGLSGRVELHGCMVGRGEKGSRFLRRLANLWEVPVWAGLDLQEDSSIHTVERFEGPVKVAFPSRLLGPRPSWDGISTLGRSREMDTDEPPSPRFSRRPGPVP